MRSPLLIKIAREILKELLSQCTPAQRTVFRDMYDHPNKYVSYNINQVVDNLDPDDLDTAIDQVDRTVQKNKSESLLPESLPF